MEIKVNIIGKVIACNNFLTFTCCLYRLETGMLVWKIKGPYDPALPILNKKQNDMRTFSYFPYEESDLNVLTSR